MLRGKGGGGEGSLGRERSGGRGGTDGLESRRDWTGVRLVAVGPSARGARGAAVDGMVGKCVHRCKETEWWRRDETRDRKFKLKNIQARRIASTEERVLLLLM